MTAVFIKIAVLAVACTVVSMLLRRGSAEMSAVLALAACACGVCAVLALMEPVVELLKKAAAFSGVSWALLLPVLKCVGIGIAAKAASDICRDGGQSALAGTVELAGAVGAVLAALPLFSALLDMLEELI